VALGRGEGRGRKREEGEGRGSDFHIPLLLPVSLSSFDVDKAKVL
jgi:hypothetical protein